MRTQWESEKRAIGELKNTKEQIEEVKLQIEEAERQYDLEKLAQLKYGILAGFGKETGQRHQERR
jgi:ATP-dependent Clp protease ATP-binding subunit ClpB